MEYEEREKLLLRLMTNEEVVNIGNRLFYIRQPTVELKFEADCLHSNLEYDLSFEGWISKKDTLDILVHLQLWTLEAEQQLEALEKSLDTFKIQLYQNYLNTTKAQQIKTQLDRTRKTIEYNKNVRSSLDHSTIEAYIASLKTQYIVALSIFDANGDPVYTKDNFWFSDSRILFKVIAYINEHRLSLTDLRELARTDPWRTYWNLGKGQTFGKPICNLSDEQRMLAIFSKMYDNAFAHPEAPPDSVINDDDVFDGWLLLQDQKRKKQVTDQNINNLIPQKIKNASELFVPVTNAEEAKTVLDMNDLATQIKLKQRQKQMENKGQVAEGQFADQQIELRQQAMKQRSEIMKGRR